MSAGTVEYSVAIIAALGASAMAGNSASPSFEIAFPTCADIGTAPLMYKLVTKI